MKKSSRYALLFMFSVVYGIGAATPVVLYTTAWRVVIIAGIIAVIALVIANIAARQERKVESPPPE